MVDPAPLLIDAREFSTGAGNGEIKGVTVAADDGG